MVNNRLIKKIAIGLGTVFIGTLIGVGMVVVTQQQPNLVANNIKYAYNEITAVQVGDQLRLLNNGHIFARCEITPTFLERELTLHTIGHAILPETPVEHFDINEYHFIRMNGFSANCPQDIVDQIKELNPGNVDSFFILVKKANKAFFEAHKEAVKRAEFQNALNNPTTILVNGDKRAEKQKTEGTPPVTQ